MMKIDTYIFWALFVGLVQVSFSAQDLKPSYNYKVYEPRKTRNDTISHEMMFARLGLGTIE